MLSVLAPDASSYFLAAVDANSGQLAEHYHRPPDKITEEQVRKYLLCLIETKAYAKSTFNVDVNAIKFLYRRTLGRDWRLLRIRGSRTNKRLPIVLSRDEMRRLLNLVRRPKPRMCLMLMHTCGQPNNLGRGWQGHLSI